MSEEDFDWRQNGRGVLETFTPIRMWIVDFPDAFAAYAQGEGIVARGVTLHVARYRAERWARRWLKEEARREKRMERYRKWVKRFVGES